MEALLIYFGKMILCSAVLFGYYHLALRNRTFHHYNRFYLLSAVVVILLLPFLKISYFTLEVNSGAYRLLATINSPHTLNTTDDGFNYFSIFIFGAGLISVFILARFFTGILKIRTFTKKYPKEEIEGISFYQTNLENAPFSFFRNLFWKKSIHLNSDLGRQILKHEMVHIEQKHTYDKIFMEVVAAIFWFNPLFWFIKKEINLIHEYLADKKAVKNMDTKAFAQMLLASHFSGTVIPATSPFLNSNLKKRLKMLQKPKTRFGYAHRILALPLVFTLAFVYAVNAKNKEIETTNKIIVAQLSEVKKDTIKEVDEKIRMQGDSARYYSDLLRKEDAKISALNRKISEKNKIVSALAKSNPDSPQLIEAEKELAALMNEQEKVWNSPEYQKKWKEFEKHSEKMEALFNSPEYQQKFSEMEKKSKEAEKIFKSKKFRKNFDKIEKVAGLEMEKVAAEAEKTAKNAVEIAEKAKNESEAAKLAAEKAAIEVEKAELAKRQAELIRKEMALKLLETKKNGKFPNTVIITGHGEHTKANEYKVTSSFSPNTTETVGSVLIAMEKSDNQKNYNIISPEMKVYLNGKAIPYSDLKKMDNSVIKSIHISKKDSNGDKNHTMYVETK